ncbi:hypothetical protein GOP47_0015923 [Adiantum capillus-veneris]|uniref:Uncharacterized protein n=1 Tax=Adiantum capillus-veneris TaxID=13818 RepID=A0A9D4ZD23_ADICA|nr:hypothetical protein GOP47_0015923 [Adiantum capillus-veneris]
MNMALIMISSRVESILARYWSLNCVDGLHDGGKEENLTALAVDSQSRTERQGEIPHAAARLHVVLTPFCKIVGRPRGCHPQKDGPTLRPLAGQKTHKKDGDSKCGLLKGHGVHATTTFTKRHLALSSDTSHTTSRAAESLAGASAPPRPRPSLFLTPSSPRHYFDRSSIYYFRSVLLLTNANCAWTAGVVVDTRLFYQHRNPLSATELELVHGRPKFTVPASMQLSEGDG